MRLLQMTRRSIGHSASDWQGPDSHLPERRGAARRFLPAVVLAALGVCLGLQSASSRVLTSRAEDPSPLRAAHSPGQAGRTTTTGRPASHGAARPARPSATATYLGNEGFLIEGAGRKVLVDALFLPTNGYQDPGPGLLADMLERRTPFERVDALLVTHTDRDHVDARLVARFMASHPETTLVAPRQVVGLLRTVEGFATWEPRVREVLERPGTTVTVALPGLTVEALPLHHHGARLVWNVAYAVDLAGFRVFHMGDASFAESAEDLKAYPFAERRPDVLFFDYWRAARSRAFLEARVRPATLVVMHLPTRGADRVVTEVRADYPAVVHFTSRGQNRTFEAQDAPAVSPWNPLDLARPPSEPEVFAPEFISTAQYEHGGPAFSAAGDEVFWTLWRRPAAKQDWPVIVTSRRTAAGWGEPAIAPFSGVFNDGDPVFTPDGRSLIFHSDRPSGADTTVRKLDLWRVDRRGDTWGEPVCLGLLARFPALGTAVSPSVAANGNLYFVADGGEASTRWAVFRAAWADGRYQAPERLPSAINLPGHLNMQPVVAPDESVLVFVSDRHAPDRDARDLWISRRRPDGTWGEAAMLPAPVNTTRSERFPTLSPDGRVLFFTRPVPGRYDDVFWVEAGRYLAPPPAASAGFARARD